MKERWQGRKRDSEGKAKDREIIDIEREGERGERE